MRWHLLSCRTLLVLLPAFALCGCSGASRTVPAGTNRIPLPPIDFTITLPSNPGIDASIVKFERLRLQEALNLQRTPSDLPPDFRMVEAFVIIPEDVALPAPARVRLVPEESLPTGTRLFLLRVGASRHCTPIDDGFVREDGSITFNTRVFGFFIVAENTLIARPSEQFICFAYASIVDGPLPLTVNFSAVPLGGMEPITYTWDVGDGSGAMAGEQLEHTYYETGDYTVTVFGTDARGAVSNNFSTMVSVTSEYQPLQSVLVAAILPTDISRPNERRFIPELVGGVPPLQWSWEFSDGFTSSEMVPIHEFPSAGLYSGTVTVTDAALDTVHANFVADVRRINLAADRAFGYIPMEVAFTVHAEGMGSGATVVLDYGDGTRDLVGPEQDVIYSHRYTNPGTYSARVEAWENFAGSLRYVYSTAVDIVCLETPVPIIYSIFPAQAEAGSEVTVFGVDFGTLQEAGDKVTFASNVEAQVVEWRDSYIKAIVPSTAVDGDVVVTRSEQATIYESNPMFFNVVEPGQVDQPPIIALLSPARGPVGTVVTLSGANFGSYQEAGDTVTIGLLPMAVASWSNDSIEATIPQFAESGNITVVRRGMVSNPKPFAVGIFPINDPPYIESVTPSTATRGSTVLVTGTNFGARLSDSAVLIGGLPMIVTSWRNTEIVVFVPSRAVNGDIRVYQWGFFSNPVPFSVKPSPPGIYGIEQF